MNENTLKRIIISTLLVLAIPLLVIIILAIFTDDNYEPPPVSYTVEYLARAGGSIKGKAFQTIKEGKNASAVTAKAEEGYEFIGWSDRVDSETRQDTPIDRNIKQIAYFRKSIKTFTYKYNGATSDTSKQNITLCFENINAETFVIPEKAGYEFGGWYLEPEFVTKAVDNHGNLMLGYGVFDSYITSDCLYAKWLTKSEKNTYKILIVFIEEIKATLKEMGKSYIDVNYRIDGFEREICQTFPSQISDTLNKWFNGKVEFEVDMYFTTQVVTSEAFKDLSVNRTSYILYANSIKEVEHMLPEYRSILTSYNMGDYESRLHDSAGTAERRYGAVHLENVFSSYILRLKNSIDELFDLNNDNRLSCINTYIHEFTHTVECFYPSDEIAAFHTVLINYGATTREKEDEVIRLYLLNQAKMNGKTVGIPFSYWEGNFNLYVNYYSKTYDYPWVYGSEPLMIIDGKEYEDYAVQTVLFGRDAKEVTVIPPKGFRFVMWSDGLTTPTRQDKKLVDYFSVGAIFERLLDVFFMDRWGLNQNIALVDEYIEAKVWDFFIGEFGTANVLSVDSKETGEHDIIHLYFSDGTDFELVSDEYAFYDYDLNKFVIINQDTIQYVGHWFNKLIPRKNSNDYNQTKVELTNVTIERAYLRSANRPRVDASYGYYINFMLAVPADTVETINAYTIDNETMMFI